MYRGEEEGVLKAGFKSRRGNKRRVKNNQKQTRGSLVTYSADIR